MSGGGGGGDVRLVDVNDDDDDDGGVIDSTSETRPKTHFGVALRYGALYTGGCVGLCPIAGWIAANVGHGVNFISVERWWWWFFFVSVFCSRRSRQGV